MVVQKELRVLIHPELNVVNIDGTPENILPVDVYVEELQEEKMNIIQKDSMFDKVKDFLHI